MEMRHQHDKLELVLYRKRMKLSIQVTVRSPFTTVCNVGLMSFVFCSESKKKALQLFIVTPKNWIHSEEQQYMENGIFCLLK